MTMYTGLARVARTTGHPVVEVPGWQTRGYGQMSAVQSVVCHHTAGPATGNYPSLATVRDGRPGLAGPLCNFGIGRDGTIYVVAAGLANHAGAVKATKYGNSHAIGIEAENTGTGQEWPAAQLDAYVRLCAALVKEFGLSVNDVQGHKEVCSPAGRKIDPAFTHPALSMDQFRAHVKAGHYGDDAPAKPAPAPAKPAAKPSKPAAKPSKPAPKPAGKAWPAAPLPVTDKHTAASDKAWHTLMAAIGQHDEKKSLTTAIERWLHGLKSPKTGKPYYSGLIEADHGQKPVFGAVLVKALQVFLADHGLYHGDIDGKRQRLTIRAEIAYLNDQRQYL